MDYILEILLALVSRAGMTPKIFFFTLLDLISLGITVTFILQSLLKPLRHLVNLYIWLIRGISLLLQLVSVFYGLPLISIAFGRYGAALFAFILNYVAYFAKVFRGGIQAILRGQCEAAKVLRLTRFQTVTRVVLPQVVKIVLSFVGSEVINLVKDTSLIYVPGLGDLLHAGKTATSRDVTLVPLASVGVICLLFTAALTVASKKIGRFCQYYK